MSENGHFCHNIVLKKGHVTKRFRVVISKGDIKRKATTRSVWWYDKNVPLSLFGIQEHKYN